MANPNTDRVIMEAMKVILPGYPTANTRLAALNKPIFVQDAYGLSLGEFPAVHIITEAQKHKVYTNLGYDGQVKICVTYYDRWDNQPSTIDAIRSQIDVDLQQMMANLQHNSSLVVGTTIHSVSIPTIELSPYAGEIDWKTVPGLTLVKRKLDATVSILPYDV